ncbi:MULTISPECIES: amino acid ABC transporter permease [Leuconostoc]|jgi:polar amino acid transport system permease protein|uniref:ABC-type amino acid transport system, permease component n=2 Tax=Leuconostoc citreum TaxID=33964 RepID=B1MZZ5_LEUCK|nr:MULTISPECIES: amino acid ABC transporter permease [Leuconostoc]ACA83097.1 ABC-type amino acid transport system, permease component [Leuconostoc citreum KM20]KAF0260944.1 amino acid ABC transporter permease [Leuconostoc citreum]MBE4726056.1 amino acid ABC transporter permease [Leuconostoc citreum]MBU7449808.1 amino acid ABC transporter permease [Leuconostoc citreum]MCK8604638.1 amino acid ABC transporter permease [Leuconostoc citreum]
MNYFLNILPSLLSGLKMTLGVFFLTIVGSVPLGIIVSLGMKSEYFTIRWLINGYIWIMRGTPLLLQLIFVYYGLGMMGITFPRFEAAAIAFIINYGAYLAEIFRGGLQAVPRGQYDAAKVLGLNKVQTFFKIILPQVIKIVVPSFGNEIINLVKDTSLVYVIGLGDILRAGNIAASRDVTLVPYLLVGMIYLLMTAIVTVLLKQSESRLNIWR